MYLSHPLRVTLGQIFVGSNNMHALSLKSVKIYGKDVGLGLTFTGSHLGNTVLMKNYTTHDLNKKVLRVDHTLGCFPCYRISLDQYVVKSFALCKALLEFLGLILEFLIGKFSHFRTQSIDSFHQRHDALCLALAVRTKNLIYYSHLM